MSTVTMFIATYPYISANSAIGYLKEEEEGGGAGGREGGRGGEEEKEKGRKGGMSKDVQRENERERASEGVRRARGEESTHRQTASYRHTSLSLLLSLSPSLPLSLSPSLPLALPLPPFPSPFISIPLSGVSRKLDQQQIKSLWVRTQKTNHEHETPSLQYVLEEAAHRGNEGSDAND